VEGDGRGMYVRWGKEAAGTELPKLKSKKAQRDWSQKEGAGTGIKGYGKREI